MSGGISFKENCLLLILRLGSMQVYDSVKYVVGNCNLGTIAGESCGNVV